MGFQCQLTSDNVSVFKNIIKGVYKEFVKSKDKFKALLLLVWLLEFFCSYHFINTRENVVVSTVRKKYEDKGMIILLDNLSKIRNTFVHTPYKTDVIEDSLSILIKYNDLNVVRQFCVVFEEDIDEFTNMYTNILIDYNSNCDVLSALDALKE